MKSTLCNASESLLACLSFLLLLLASCFHERIIFYIVSLFTTTKTFLFLVLLSFVLAHKLFHGTRDTLRVELPK
jgi:hypothetical protein